jgi:hypothetical protein
MASKILYWRAAVAESEKPPDIIMFATPDWQRRSARGLLSAGCRFRVRAESAKARGAMAADKPDNVVLMEPAATALRDEFVGWQCRIRQLSARQAGGRPSPGMRPRVLTPEGDELAPGITVLIVEAEPKDSTALFRFQYLKTHDPIERYDKAIEILSASYFQQPRNFGDALTALFGPQSTLVARLLNHGRCVLEFEEYSQAYRLPCAVAALAESDPLYQATYWHNHLFNPDLPPGIHILCFTPDWAHASGWRVEVT